jgi:16S rRNA (cytidine1402-2'-O)-methyltransferase
LRDEHPLLRMVVLREVAVPLAVCATPIGNLEDVTLRVLRELGEADVVLAEDTRHTKGLLDRHGIRATLVSYHRHNEAQRTAELVPRLEAGERVALVSDAGLPGVNDPGARLIAAALAGGVPVTVLPGPSAVETALVASGLAGERFQFVGYLPRGEKALRALWEELADWPHPAVAFESPRRLPTALRSLAAVLPDRPVAVCRELTKRFEEVVRGSAVELADRLREAPKGELTLVLGAAEAAGGPPASEAVAAVGELVAAGVPRRQAADVVARLARISRNTLYAESLKSR